MRRLPAPGPLLDQVVAAGAVALTALVVWVQPVPVGTPIAGPTWFRVVFPLLFAAPLAWRRTAPLAASTLTMAALAAQALLSANSPEGLQLIFVVGLATYSVAAHSGWRSAVAGLLGALAAYAIYAWENHDIRSGSADNLWAGAFFLVALVAMWLIGVFVRGRREERRRREQTAAVELQAAQTAAEERSRLARELHDVISHTLSVVVLQAAGARASGSATPETLEKIESSGRESLSEMRRLLDVLRRDRDDGGLAPQPGVADLEGLAAQLTDAGLPVELEMDGDVADLPAVLGLSVYRIVQESLTNVLKHAGAARARVTVRSAADAVTVEVLDDGSATEPAGTGGHGLVGMRERVALFGGDFRAGPRPEGGFAVHARLPRDQRPA